MSTVIAACSEQPARTVWAKVVSIAPPAQPKWHSDEVVVVVRTPDGTVGFANVPSARLACRVGDTVRATVRGIAMTLNAHLCER